MGNTNGTTSVSVELTERARECLTGLRSRFHMVQKAALEHVIEWLAEQEPLIQAIALGQLRDELAEDVIELIYQQHLREKQAAQVVADAGDGEENAAQRPAG